MNARGCMQLKRLQWLHVAAYLCNGCSGCTWLHAALSCCMLPVRDRQHARCSVLLYAAGCASSGSGADAAHAWCCMQHQAQGPQLKEQAVPSSIQMP
eukprot:353149-Chlamydomonas_euryale.AAC.18